MFLSKVILQTRSTAAHRILADLYRQHQFILSAFPDQSTALANSEAPTSDNRPSVLYRIETYDGGNRLFFLVQSDEEPDWERSSGLHPGTVATSCVKTIEPLFSPGQSLRFRLRANPTMMHVNGDINVRADHKRCGLYKEAEQLAWLERHAGRSGFQIVRDVVRIASLGVQNGEKPAAKEGGKGHTVKCLTVDFDGVLTVDDADAFLAAFRKGIGRGKAWGCGMLSLAQA
jgi:CRISPR system Cascade subunit CasE